MLQVLVAVLEGMVELVGLARGDPMVHLEAPVVVDPLDVRDKREQLGREGTPDHQVTYRLL